MHTLNARSDSFAELQMINVTHLLVYFFLQAYWYWREASFHFLLYWCLNEGSLQSRPKCLGLFLWLLSWGDTTETEKERH